MTEAAYREELERIGEGPQTTISTADTPVSDVSLPGPSLGPPPCVCGFTHDAPMSYQFATNDEREEAWRQKELRGPLSPEAQRERDRVRRVFERSHPIASRLSRSLTRGTRGTEGRDFHTSRDGKFRPLFPGRVRPSVRRILTWYAATLIYALLIGRLAGMTWWQAGLLGLIAELAAVQHVHARINRRDR